MNPILVSIITVSYNSEKTIQKTIESVLNQTYKNIEYIIIDGASTDTTLEIVKSYEEKFEGRLKIISEPDSGIYNAMNKGIKMANGSLIGIINSDDYYEEKAVEHMVGAMTQDKYQILYGALRIIENGIETTIMMNKHENLKNKMIAHPTCFITKNVYTDLGFYNEEYRSCSDYDFMLDKIDNDDVHFIPVYKIIAAFNQGSGMSSKVSSYMESLKMQRKHGVISKKSYMVNMAKIYVRKILKW